MRSFRDLLVWQRAHQLALSIYKMSSHFPSEERYGLTSQLRRAALSIPNNLAEGSKRKNPSDFAHFINIAEGSCAEVDYLLLFVKDMEYVSKEIIEPYTKEVAEIGRMLHSLRSKQIEASC
jgi:four helix bundle protein